MGMQYTFSSGLPAARFTTLIKQECYSTLSWPTW